MLPCSAESCSCFGFVHSFYCLQYLISAVICFPYLRVYLYCIVVVIVSLFALCCSGLSASPSVSPAVWAVLNPREVRERKSLSRKDSANKDRSALTTGPVCLLFVCLLLLFLISLFLYLFYFIFICLSILAFCLFSFIYLFMCLIIYLSFTITITISFIYLLIISFSCSFILSLYSRLGGKDVEVSAYTEKV
jgi:hypothetical protein